MPDKQEFLDRAYEAATSDETLALYKDWAQSYDDEVEANGYSTPPRCAKALAQFAPDLTQPVLDFGCGTGISGLALRDAGFSFVDGCDLSVEMLEVAKAKEAYRFVWQSTLDNPFPFEPGTYSHFSAMGVIASNHAPPETIDAILAVLPTDGLFVFSLNDHTLEDPQFEARIAENLDCGAARLLFKEHGDHLPKIGMGSNVYVMQKT